jgi:hypothetical protein
VSQRRRPSPASSHNAIPTLASLVAGAGIAQGCAPVECGPQRADEVRVHGPRGTEALRRGDLGDAVREVAIAAGLVRHGATQVFETRTAGAVEVVTPQPPPPDEGMPRPGSRRRVRAGARPIGVTPPPPSQVPPPPSPQHRDPFATPPPPSVPLGGAPMPVTPQPPSRRE